MKKIFIVFCTAFLATVMLAMSCAPPPPPAATAPPAKAPAATAPVSPPTTAPKTETPATKTPATTTPAKVYKLRTHTHVPQSHTVAVRMAWWDSEVTKRTNGAVQFQRFYSGTLVSQKDQPMGLKTGLFDVGILSPATYIEMFRSWGVPQLPSLKTADTRVIVEAAAEFAALPGPSAEFKTANVKYLFTAPTGSRMILSKKSARTLADLKGLRVRETNAIVSQMWASVGMNPIAIETSEQYDALSKGTLDAISATLPSMNSWGVQDVAKYLLKLPLPDVGLIIAVNLDTWNSLPKDIQKVMLDVAAETIEYSNNVVTNEQKDILALWKTKNVQVIEFTPAELETLYKGAEPIVQKWIKDYAALLPTQELYKTWNDLIAKYMNKYGVKVGE